MKKHSQKVVIPVSIMKTWGMCASSKRRSSSFRDTLKSSHGKANSSDAVCRNTRPNTVVSGAWISCQCITCCYINVWLHKWCALRSEGQQIGRARKAVNGGLSAVNKTGSNKWFITKVKTTANKNRIMSNMNQTMLQIKMWLVWHF